MFQQVAVFLISTLSSLYIVAVLLRFLLALTSADFHNPLSQFLFNITQPILKPLRRFIPPMGKIDTSSLVLALGVKMLAMLLIYGLSGRNISLLHVILASIADLTRLLIWIFIVALIIQAVISWVGNTHGNPMASLLHSLTTPILKPLRNVVPTIGMVDLSPLAAIVILQVMLIFLSGLPTM